MISIMIPSRGRPDELLTSINSLQLTKHGLEALVWVDTDDPKLARYQELFSSNTNIKLFIKERIGYIQFHSMLNFLASQASYDWIFEWNDDATMPNPNWFGIFNRFVQQFNPLTQPIVINIWGQGEVVANLFPIVSRCYLNILQHFSLAPPCDEWVRVVGVGAHISYDLKGIKPDHRKYGSDNPLKDETFYEVERQRAEVKKTWNERRHILPRDLLDSDISKIVKYQHEHQTR